MYQLGRDKHLATRVYQLGRDMHLATRVYQLGRDMHLATRVVPGNRDRAAVNKWKNIECITLEMYCSPIGLYNVGCSVPVLSVNQDQGSSRVINDKFKGFQFVLCLQRV